MPNYHINENGPAVCHATVQDCPVSSKDDHTTDLATAEKNYNTRLERMNKRIEEEKKHMSKEELQRGSLEKLSEIIAKEELNPTRKDSAFKYTTVGEKAKIQEKILENEKYFKNYKHDYDSYNPDERPGEREFVKNYDPTKYTTVKVSQTADNIILHVDDDGDLKVLMIQRGGFPYKGAWAHPGGFIDNVKDKDGKVLRRETREEAASRELEEETSIVLPPSIMIPVSTYDHPGRDPRMEVVMNTHVVLMDDKLDFKAADDAADAKFISVKNIFDGSTPIAFDHKQSIKDALEYVLNSK